MGQIANQMLIEAIYKVKDQLNQKKEEKQMKESNLLKKNKETKNVHEHNSK